MQIRLAAVVRLDVHDDNSTGKEALPDDSSSWQYQPASKLAGFQGCDIII